MKWKPFIAKEKKAVSKELFFCERAKNSLYIFDYFIGPQIEKTLVNYNNFHKNFPKRKKLRKKN